MKCYKCNANLSESDFCVKCGADVKVYKKIIMTSEIYYNLGLEKAKNRDLSGAIECLKQSVKLNKHNINARNLLGLVYFETGEIVAALSQWVISTNLKPEKNMAEKYLNSIKRNAGKLNTINQTIKKYNQTVTYVLHKNEDLAIIQLKKVLSLYPNMVKGHQLLALLHMKTGDYERALKEIKRALAIDRNNTLSMQYYSEIQSELDRIKKENGSDKGGKGKSVQNRNVNLAYVSVPDPELDGNFRSDDMITPPAAYKESSGSGGLIIINLILGIALGVALFWFLILPSKLAQNEEDFNNKLADKNATIDSNALVISNLQDAVKALESEKTSLDRTIMELKQENSVIPIYKKLLEGVDLYFSNKYIPAYEFLKEFNMDEIEDATYISVYDSVVALNNIKAAELYYESGYSNYSSKKYAEAAAQLQISFNLNPDQLNTVYFLARAYDFMPDEGTDARAKIYYQIVIDKWPNSTYASNSKGYIKNIKE